MDRESIDRIAAIRLPRHMRPTSVGAIQTMPLNANGKVDRKALATAMSIPGASEASSAGPDELTPVEAKVASIWEQVLGVDKVERDDALFDLGADSLQIFRISARMADVGLGLDNRRLLANPTLRELCSGLEEAGAEPSRTSAGAMSSLSSYRRSAKRAEAL